MLALYITPIVLSLLLLGAHFYRHGATLSLVGVIALMLLLFVQRPWAARVVQIALVLATFEWIRTLAQLIVGHLQGGRPFFRLTLILIFVILMTGFSAFAFQSPRLRERYRIGHGGGGA